MKTSKIIIAVMLALYSMNSYSAEEKKSEAVNAAKDQKEAPVKDLQGTVKIDEAILAAIDYPELQVVPRASDRLNMEKDIGMMSWWPYFISGSATLFAGNMHRGKYRDSAASDQTKADSDWAANLGVMSGLFTISAAAYLGTQDYYAEAQANVKKYAKPDGGKLDKRGELLKERIAEEALERAAISAKRMMWSAFVANFLTSGYILTYAQDGTRPLVFASLATSFMPIIFTHRYQQNYEKHLEYKRKIYAPLASVRFDQDKNPQMALTWVF